MERSYAMNKYQITLKPIDKFFFGGDMTFQVGNNKDDAFNEQFSSYIIKSSIFPQQTSLLGMLRFLILRNAGEKIFSNGKITDKSKAKELIGEKSFSVNETHSQNNFGKIRRISHVKIRKTVNGQTKDLEFKALFGNVSFKKTSCGMFGLKEFNIPDIPKETFNAKKGLCCQLTDGTDTIALTNVFKEDRRIGINRDITTGKTENDALFKQISYRFNNRETNYCFVFDAEVDDDINLENYNGQIVSIGGDNSQFTIGITKEEKGCNCILSSSNAITILSPTFLTKEEAQYADFAVTQLMPFRFLQSNIDIKSYHILSKNLTRSQKYELYAPGSVFYFINEEKKKTFITSIESKKEFRQIGYNEYK